MSGVAAFLLDLAVAGLAQQSCIFKCVAISGAYAVDHRVLLRQGLSAYSARLVLCAPLLGLDLPPDHGTTSLIVHQYLRDLAVVGEA